jgi:hypothetical protein
MKYRVRLERVVMYLSSITTTFTRVVVRIVFATILAVVSVVAGTMLAPTLIIYCITTRATFAVSFLTMVAIERMVFPATFAP